LKIVPQFFEGALQAIKGITKAIIVMKGAFEAAGERIGGVLAILGSTTGKLLAGSFNEAIDIVKNGLVSLKEDTVNTFKKVAEELDTVDEAFKSSSMQRENEVTANLETNAQKRAELRQLEKEAELENEAIKREELHNLRLMSQEELDVALLDKQLEQTNSELAQESNKTKRLQLESKRRKLEKDKAAAEDRQRSTALNRFQQFLNSQKVSDCAAAWPYPSLGKYHQPK